MISSLDLALLRFVSLAENVLTLSKLALAEV